MYYRIRHLTRFAYSDPVYESLMELRMHPRTEGNQRCLDYKVIVTPKAQIHPIATIWAIRFTISGFRVRTATCRSRPRAWWR